MGRSTTAEGDKNLIGDRLITLRLKNDLSQRDLAKLFKANGYNMDRNVITRIETHSRAVSDIELKAIHKVFDVSYDYLLEGKEE